MKLWRIASLMTLLLLLLAGPPARAQQAPLAGLDDYVTKAMKDWGVPGLAIAVIKDDRVVLARGYGVRELGKPEPVDERTIFAIGSSSKAFTAAAIAMLVDEKKLKWDDPATQYLPDLQLYDPYASRELTVRDLLTHRVGLDRGDQLWYATTLEREEILRRVRYLKPSSSMRSRFGYQNLMFLAAGQIVRSVSGKEWDDFVRERIFVPLGMNDTGTSVRTLSQSRDVAAPHAEVRRSGRAHPLPQCRQHRSCRLDQLERRGYGTVGSPATRGWHVCGQALDQFRCRQGNGHAADHHPARRSDGQALPGSSFSELRTWLVSE